MNLIDRKFKMVRPGHRILPGDECRDGDEWRPISGTRFGFRVKPDEEVRRPREHINPEPMGYSTEILSMMKINVLARLARQYPYLNLKSL